jgi:NAD(P)-dependent dehydrogenase (short-subunit alcohol dehydrogenase family)
MAAIRGFAGRNVLVTGASSGIGNATALAFAKAGANVVLVARRREVLEAVAKEARKRGPGKVLCIPTDVTRQAEVNACFRRAVREFRSIDLVVNNAGVFIPSKVEDIRARDLRRMLDVNLFGALYVLQAAVRQMRAQGRGSIVNVASLAGRRGFTLLGGYSATKFALVGLTEALRSELVGENIHVSLVMPSVIDTPMGQEIDSNAVTKGIWPKALTLPPSWVVWAIFAAARFRLAEIGVPPGSAAIEKLASLAPGTVDSLLKWGVDVASKSRKRKTSMKSKRGRTNA